MKKEIWKCIPGFPKYIASDLGNIMRLPELSPTYSGKVSTRGRFGKVLSPRATHYGHLQVSVENENGKRSFQYVHRLVAMAFLKSRRGCEIVCHRDDNPANNKVNNLFWGTQYINMNMIYGRKRILQRRDRTETQKIISDLYRANIQGFTGSVKELFEKIGEDLGYSAGHINAMYYAKDNQHKILVKDLVNSK